MSNLNNEYITGLLKWGSSELFFHSISSSLDGMDSMRSNYCNNVNTSLPIKCTLNMNIKTFICINIFITNDDKMCIIDQSNNHKGGGILQSIDNFKSFALYLNEHLTGIISYSNCESYVVAQDKNGNLYTNDIKFRHLYTMRNHAKHHNFAKFKLVQNIDQTLHYEHEQTTNSKMLVKSSEHYTHISILTIVYGIIIFLWLIYIIL